ncbi:testicular haploid expressed gene protein [Tachyglossus aculeatus]|uniref:testicular haploid expressed gene protein n=1 Tax=Tachyglossus aculeatus TaxID=9261 RepID=UPI0018F5DC3F|nr:testicular haploid expressed gene protein [Tachyglossus aculeatus]
MEDLGSVFPSNSRVKDRQGPLTPGDLSEESLKIKTSDNKTNKKSKTRTDALTMPKINHQIPTSRSSGHWTDKKLPDNSHKMTMPTISLRLEQLAKPKPIYLFYNENRRSPIWNVSRAALLAEASPRLKTLSAPKTWSNSWMTEHSISTPVSKAALTTQAKPRTLELAVPKKQTVPSTEKLNKTKFPSSDLKRLQLIEPKPEPQSHQPKIPAQRPVVEDTKNAVASPRIMQLAKPKERKGVRKDYNPYLISPATLMAEASPRTLELSTPRNVKPKKF